MKIEKGMIAVVTGASRGLGVFIAEALARKGVSLVIAARSEEGLTEVAGELVRKYEVDVLPLVTDVSNVESIKSLVEASIRRFGRIDILVNNAGIDYAQPYDHAEIEDIYKMVEINLVGPLVLTRLVITEMLKNEQGHIVNIASLAGLMPSPYEELYTTTKHGLVGFTRSLRASAQDMNWPISASVICPGFMEDAGIYENMKKDYGVKAPDSLGSMSAKKLGDNVIRAIEDDLPDVLMMKGAPRVAVASLALVPKIYERITAKMDTAALFRKVALAHVEERIKMADKTVLKTESS